MFVHAYDFMNKNIDVSWRFCINIYAWQAIMST